MSSWFDDQIQMRKELDEEKLEEAFIHAAASVLGKKGAVRLGDNRVHLKEAVDSVLKFYHLKPVEIPDDITDDMERLEYSLRPHGMMSRKVKLDKGWYKKAYGPMIGKLTDSGLPIALIPGRAGIYTFIDPETGKSHTLNRSNESRVSLDAICFYRPFPCKSLHMRDLLRYMLGTVSVRSIVGVIIVSVVISSLGIFIPTITHAMTSQVVETGSLRMLITIALSLLLIRLSSLMFDAVKEFLIKRMEIAASLQVEAAVMARLLSLPSGFFKKYSSGELSTRASAVQEISNIVIEEVFGLGILSLTSLINITQIVHYSPSLVVPALFVILLTFITMVVCTILRTRINKMHAEHEAKERGLKYSLITGMRKIRAAGAENRAFAGWADMYAEGASLKYDPPMLLKVQEVLLTSISLLGTVVIYGVANQTGVHVEDYYAFNASYSIVMGAFVSLAATVTQISRIRPAIDMAEPILREIPEIDSHMRPINITGGLEVSHVSFKYNEGSKYVINDLSFAVKKGEYVGIVGKTGCGKSTLIRLLLGFEKPEKGVIYYGNSDISKYDLRSLRSQIGVVLQNGELMPGSIFENIAVSKPMMTASEAWEAAEAACIADDIRKMPMGMNTVISEGHGGISGGQKQRILIARALAHKPKLLIFDEATSALDNKRQKAVTESLDELNCTRIVVAHRLSTIKGCDRILVMDEGRIAESGTYDELLSQGGIFAELVERQRL